MGLYGPRKSWLCRVGFAVYIGVHEQACSEVRRSLQERKHTQRGSDLSSTTAGGGCQPVSRPRQRACTRGDWGRRQSEPTEVFMSHLELLPARLIGSDASCCEL